MGTLSFPQLPETMARPQPVKDPAQFLKDLVVRLGESEQYATVFRGANLLYTPQDHCHSDTYDDTMGLLVDLVEEDENYRSFVSRLSHTGFLTEKYEFPNYFGIKGVCVFVRHNHVENDFSVTFLMPQIDAQKFWLDIQILGHIALHWAKLAREDLTEVRVFIDYTFLRWEDMEEENLLFTEFESD